MTQEINMNPDKEITQVRMGDKEILIHLANAIQWTLDANYNSDIKFALILGMTDSNGEIQRIKAVGNADTDQTLAMYALSAENLETGKSTEVRVEL